MEKVRIRWTIATNLDYYGPDAEADDIARAVAREHTEVASYVATRWPSATIETEEMPETVSFGNQSRITINGEMYNQEDDPSGMLDAIGHFVERHYQDWAEPS